MYFTNRDDNTVSVIDTLDNSGSGTITVDDYLQAIAELIDNAFALIP